MQLNEYSDDEILEEVKHRGFEIAAFVNYKDHTDGYITIGGIVFDLRT